MPRGLGRVAAAALGALAVAAGVVALLNGRVAASAVVACGILLIGWSVLKPPA